MNLRRGEGSEVHDLHDVDTCFDQQDTVNGQRCMPFPRSDHFVRDRLRTGHPDIAFGKPYGRGLAGTRSTGYLASEEVGIAPMLGPACADQNSITGTDSEASSICRSLEIVDGHLISRFEYINSAIRSYIEHDTAAQNRIDGIDPKPRETVVGLRGRGVDTAVHEAVLRYVTEGIDMCPNVTTKHEYLIGC